MSLTPLVLRQGVVDRYRWPVTGVEGTWTVAPFQVRSAPDATTVLDVLTPELVDLGAEGWAVDLPLTPEISNGWTWRGGFAALVLIGPDAKPRPPIWAGVVSVEPLGYTP